jgi:hypothetical protein
MTGRNAITSLSAGSPQLGMTGTRPGRFDLWQLTNHGLRVAELQRRQLLNGVTGSLAVPRLGRRDEQRCDELQTSQALSFQMKPARRRRLVLRF